MHGMENIRNCEIIIQMLSGQITGLGDESVTASLIEDVFGFTAKNIYLGRDNLSASLYRISISMRIAPDVTVMLVV